MKRLVFVVMGVLFAMVILSVGCTPKAAPPAAPPAVSPGQPVVVGNATQNASGFLIGINPPSMPGQDVVVVQTPQGGIVAIPIGPNTHYFLENQACKLEDVLAVEASTNVSYNCKIWYDDETGFQNVYIAK